MQTRAKKGGQTKQARQQQQGNMYRRIQSHVYEIMHMLYVCKHTQQTSGKQHMQTNIQNGNMYNRITLHVWTNAYVVHVQTRAQHIWQAKNMQHTNKIANCIDV